MVDKNVTSVKSKPGPSQMPPKWLLVIDLMVIGGLDFQPAMEQVGYAEAYYKSNGHQIKQDTRFCKALAAKKATLTSKSENRREKRLKTLDKIIDSPDSLDRDIISATQVQGRMCGWLSETIKHETTERQNLLDSANKKEAARLAILSLDTRQLPETSHGRKAVECAIIDANEIDEEKEDVTVTSDIDEVPPIIEDVTVTGDTIVHPIDFSL